LLANNNVNDADDADDVNDANDAKDADVNDADDERRRRRSSIEEEKKPRLDTSLDRVERLVVCCSSAPLAASQAGPNYIFDTSKISEFSEFSENQRVQRIISSTHQILILFENQNM
jgi:hypothetical protein